MNKIQISNMFGCVFLLPPPASVKPVSLEKEDQEEK